MNTGPTHPAAKTLPPVEKAQQRPLVTGAIAWGDFSSMLQKRSSLKSQPEDQILNKPKRYSFSPYSLSSLYQYFNLIQCIFIWCTTPSCTKSTCSFYFESLFNRIENSLNSQRPLPDLKHFHSREQIVLPPLAPPLAPPMYSPFCPPFCRAKTALLLRPPGPYICHPTGNQKASWWPLVDEVCSWKCTF